MTTIAPAKVGLILFSHGSLLCGAGAILDTHVQRLQESQRFTIATAGYLNYSEPPIEVAVERCTAAGVDHVVIVPYFLVAGKFVREDLPKRLAELRAGAAANVKISMARAVEDAPAMLDLVLSLSRQGADPAAWQGGAIRKARQQCELRESCPLYGSSMCRASMLISDAASAMAQEPPADQHPPLRSGLGGDTRAQRGLLLVLHGSPRPEANLPALEIAAKIRAGAGARTCTPSNEAACARTNISYVETAYLECNEPSIPLALDNAAAAGVTHLDVVPYFLHPGRHLVLDIPGHIADSRARNPHMEIAICPPVGETTALTEILLQRALESLQSP